MARFYFHLNDGKSVLIDSEGVELPDPAAAAQRALDSARDILSAEIREGRVPLDMHLAVEDERGLTIQRTTRRRFDTPDVRQAALERATLKLIKEVAR